MDPLLYTLITRDRHANTTTSTSNPTMPYPNAYRAPITAPPPFSPTNTTTTSSTSSTPSTMPPATPPQRLHRLYTDLPEHHYPSPTDPIIPHGSPLSSRLHRRLEGIRAAISREADLQCSPTSQAAGSTHAPTHGGPTPAHRRSSHGSDSSEADTRYEASWSPSQEASEAEYVRRRDAQEGEDVKTRGWPGLGIFEDRGASAMVGRPGGKGEEEGWGWPGLGWVEYRPRK